MTCNFFLSFFSSIERFLKLQGRNFFFFFVKERDDILLNLYILFTTRTRKNHHGYENEVEELFGGSSNFLDHRSEHVSCSLLLRDRSSIDSFAKFLSRYANVKLLLLLLLNSSLESLIKLSFLNK